MQKDVITSNVPVGTLAALLTALEYVLSLITALCARAAVHGFWLLRLHRGGEAPLDSYYRTKRAFRKDVISFILGLWLVVGVALVESNLQVGVRLHDQQANSSLCVSVDGRYNPERVKDLKPPYRTTVEPWVLSVAKDIDCGDRGISSVGVGGSTDSFGTKQNMSAPVCAKSAVDIRRDAVKASITVAEMEESKLEPKLGKTQVFAIFPYSSKGLGHKVENLGLEVEGSGVCGNRGISAMYYDMDADFETTFAHSRNISFAMHERVCVLHGDKAINTISDEEANTCLDFESEYLNVGCLREKASPEQLYKVRIADVNALFVGKELDSASYACVDGVVELEYIFVTATFSKAVTELKDGEVVDGPELPVLIPTTAQMVEGHCEKTIAPLANAALVYTADAEWRGDQLAIVKRRIRFYAYLMAVSSSQFPLNAIRGEESATVNGTCLIRPVFDVTEIAKDWRLLVLLLGLVFSALVVLLGVVFRVLFTGESWRVGSAEWSLSQFIDNGRVSRSDEGPSTLVEVVPVPVEEGFGGPRSGGLVHKRSNFLVKRQPSAEHDELGEPAAPLGTHWTYEYRVRTQRNSAEGRSPQKFGDPFDESYKEFDR